MRPKQGRRGSARRGSDREATGAKGHRGTKAHIESIADPAGRLFAPARRGLDRAGDRRGGDRSGARNGLRAAAGHSAGAGNLAATAGARVQGQTVDGLDLRDRRAEHRKQKPDQPFHARQRGSDSAAAQGRSLRASWHFYTTFCGLLRCFPAPRRRAGSPRQSSPSWGASCTRRRRRSGRSAHCTSPTAGRSWPGSARR